MASSTPQHILIVGSGVFGLSTALSLTQRPSCASTKITVLDRSPFPSPDGSSIDSSRIVRADYSNPAYASLAAAAQKQWRETSPSQLGGEGRYTETGLVFVADKGHQGEAYVQASYDNVKRMMEEAGDVDGVVALEHRNEIDAAAGTDGGSGDWGYINKRSGWANAEESMIWLRKQVAATNRVNFVHGEAKSLLREGKKVTGAQLKDGSSLHADLVVLATGAWTGALVDLRGRAQATGQVMAYLDLTAAEQERLDKIPVLLNMSSGLFILPPRNNILKVARHAYGYSNPVEIPNPDISSKTEMITVSLPRTSRDEPNQWIPAEGETALRGALAEMIPWLADRPFTRTRVCWYTDTPKGDFLITYHPEFEGLFLATGGSGHGFKFLPAIGGKIADCIENICGLELTKLWAWPEEKVDNVVTQDGTRGGIPGQLLDEEMNKGRA